MLPNGFTRRAVSMLDLSQHAEESEDINAVLALLSADQPIAKSKSSDGKGKNNPKIPVLGSPSNTGYVATGNQSSEANNWVEITPEAPITSRLRPPILPSPISASVQSLYTPTLLSYDPIHNAPPGHTSLATSPRPSSSVGPPSSEENEKSNDKDERDSRLKSSLKRGPNQSTEVTGETSAAPVGPATKMKEIDDESPHPGFQRQREMWLSDWGSPSSASSQTRPESDDLTSTSIKRNVQPSYAPPQAKKEMNWIEPKAESALPPPRSLSQEESKRAIQEARDKRKSNPPGSSQDPERKSQQISSSKIMKTKVVERALLPSAAPPPMRGINGDSIEGYSPALSRDQIRVSPHTSLSGLSIQPFQLQGSEDASETRQHDEKIVGEIQSLILLQNQNEEKKEGEDEDDGLEGQDDQEEEMDSIVKQNFFLYMWTCLEDLFGYEVISWMNDLENQLEEHDADTNEHDDEDADEDKAHAPVPTQDDEDNENFPQTRQVLNLPSLHHDTSIFHHMTRGINHVEKIMQIHSFLLKYHHLINTNTNKDTTNIYELYLQHKKKLFSLIRIDETFNPSFNQKQWIFLSLLIIDAILCKKIFLSDNIPTIIVTTPTSAASAAAAVNVTEILQNWNNKFNAYAAGILGGGGRGADDILNERQIANLRHFFTVET